MPKVFISYNREAQAKVEALAADLEQLGCEVWLDQALTGGQIWWDEILERIRATDWFVLALTPGSLASEACRREYGYADALGKPILPVLVGDGVSTNRLPRALARYQIVDYRREDKRSVLGLSRAIRELPEPGPLPDPLPEPPPAPLSYLTDLSERVETREALDFAQQSALLIELKEGLRRGEDREDVLGLLRALRGRRDLLASIGDEIDEILEAVPRERAAPPSPSAQEPATAPALEPGASIDPERDEGAIRELVRRVAETGEAWALRAGGEDSIVVARRSGRLVARATCHEWLHGRSNRLRGMGWKIDALVALRQAAAVFLAGLALGLPLLSPGFRAAVTQRTMTNAWDSGRGAAAEREIAETIATALRVLAPRATRVTVGPGADAPMLTDLLRDLVR